jgi:hypothetical protein
METYFVSVFDPNLRVRDFLLTYTRRIILNPSFLFGSDFFLIKNYSFLFKSKAPCPISAEREWNSIAFSRSDILRKSRSLREYYCLLLIIEASSQTRLLFNLSSPQRPFPLFDQVFNFLERFSQIQLLLRGFSFYPNSLIAKSCTSIISKKRGISVHLSK